MSRILSSNEWILINDIALKLHALTNAYAIETAFLDMIELLISNDAACFFLSDNTEKSLLTSPAASGSLTIEDLEEYLQHGQEMDYLSSIMRSRKCMVYRETDYFSDEVREADAYFQKYYKPKNFHFCTQVVLSYENVFLGVAALYRKLEDGDYSDRDLFVLDILKDHIALSLYRAKQKERSDPAEKSQADFDTIADNYHLTKREAEVLKLLVSNYTNQEIADRLVISVHTLKKHILNIYKKTSVTSRVQLLKLFSERR